MPPTYIRFLVAVCVTFCFIIGCLVNWAPSASEGDLVSNIAFCY